MARSRYGPAHRARRKAEAPAVARGQAQCTEPICLTELDTGSRWIEPGTPWDLAHDTDAPDGTPRYRGPAHARCNRTEGSHRATPARAREAAGLNRWTL